MAGLSYASVFIIFAAMAVYRYLEKENAFITIRPHGNKNCQIQKGMTGAEDFAADWKNNFMIISADDRDWYPKSLLGSNISQNMILLDKPKLKDGFFLYDFSSNSYSALKINFPSNFELEDFHPHGIDLVKLKTKNILLAVSHTRHGDYVILFQLITNKANEYELNYLNHIGWQGFVSLNDVTGFMLFDESGQEKDNEIGFYASNWLAVDAGSPLAPILLLLQQRLGSVVSCRVELNGNKKDCRYEMKNISPNGIIMDPEYKHVLIAEFHENAVLFFPHNPKPNAPPLSDLQQSNAIYMPTKTYLDNLLFANDGDLYIGSHPQGLEFARHKDSPNHEHPSPSQVFRCHRRGSEWEISEIFLSNGTDYSGSSVAVVHNKNLFIGSVFNDGILVCPYVD